MSEEIKNNQIPEEIKNICRSCEENIHCQNKGCAFRSLGNEYCDYVLNATKLYLDLQQKVEQLESIRKEAIEFIEWHYKDNKEFFKNKGIGLNYPECDALLNTLNKGSEDSE